MATIMSVELNAIKKLLDKFKTLPLENQTDPAFFLELCKNSNYHRNYLKELFTIAPQSIKENREIVSYLVKNRVSILEQTPFITDEELLIVSLNSQENIANVSIACLKEPLLKQNKGLFIKAFFIANEVDIPLLMDSMDETLSVDKEFIKECFESMVRLKDHFILTELISSFISQQKPIILADKDFYLLVLKYGFFPPERFHETLMDDIDIAQTYFLKYERLLTRVKHTPIVFPQDLFSQRIVELYQEAKGDFDLMKTLAIQAEQDKIRFKEKMNTYQPVNNLFKRTVI